MRVPAASQGQQRPPQFLSTHPSDETRIRQLEGWMPEALAAESYDLNQNVVGKSLDGLFHVLGDEERKIRTNPGARVMELLKDVFGSTARR